MQKIREDLVGQKFGNLIVIDGIYKGTGKRRTFHWVCKCGCGKETQVREGRIHRSLGCVSCARVLSIRKKNSRYGTPCYSLKRRVFLQYKTRAKAMNLEFTLTEEEGFKLMESNCKYCGIEPVERSSGNKVDGKLRRNGIDRVNSDKGYTQDNVVSCCSMCNMAKLDSSAEDFLNWIKRVYNFQNNKNNENI